MASSSPAIIAHLNAAAKELQQAYALATKANAMAADLPVFQAVQQMQKDVGTLMQQVSKVRGL